MNLYWSRLFQVAVLLVSLLCSGCVAVEEALKYDGPDLAEEREIQDREGRLKESRFPGSHITGAGADIK